MSVVHVIAILSAKPGKRSAVLSIFNANITTVLAEEGCIVYEATIDAENSGPGKASFGPDTFVVVEKWSSMDALKTHSNSAHMQAFGAATKDMMANRTVHFLSPA
ncbi:MAG: putative quinol monooxygenase [Octadecabacter sp.]|nr:putative quinol monooxygenase [Octadecabacter sp.]